MELIVGIFLGMMLYSSYIKLKEALELKRIEKKVTEKLNEFREKVINSRIEELQGCLYLFNSDTDEFLCQASTFDELEKIASEKFPGKLFNVPPDQLKKYIKD